MNDIIEGETPVVKDPMKFENFDFKKNLPFILSGALAVVLLLGAGIFALRKITGSKTADKADAAQAAPKKKRRNDPINQIAVSERPYMLITPSSSGRSVILSVEELKKPANTVDYELEYQSGELLQGAFGSLELPGGKATKDILLGSCSAGGACTYHQNVKGGTLLNRFAADDGYAVKTDWRYIENTGKTEIASSDGKFVINSKELAKQRTLVVFTSPGFPGEPSGTVISDIYAVTTVAPITGTGSVSIELSEAATSATMLGWDGKAWQKLSTVIEAQKAKADGPLYQAYLVVKE